jgi:hypothetical protein
MLRVAKDNSVALVLFFSFYVLSNDVVVERRNWKLFQTAITTLRLLQNDHLLAMFSGESSLASALRSKNSPTARRVLEILYGSGIALTSRLGFLLSSLCRSSSSMKYKNSTFIKVSTFGFSGATGVSGSLQRRRNDANPLTDLFFFRLLRSLRSEPRPICLTNYRQQ